MKRLLTAVIVAVVVLTASPAEARDYPKLKTGEVVVCPASKVRIYEDNTATCIKRTYRYKKWSGYEVGDYIKCGPRQMIRVVPLNDRSTAEWARCWR